jgi:hypothetical protein
MGFPLEHATIDLNIFAPDRAFESSRREMLVL